MRALWLLCEDDFSLYPKGVVLLFPWRSVVACWQVYCQEVREEHRLYTAGTAPRLVKEAQRLSQKPRHHA